MQEHDVRNWIVAVAMLLSLLNILWTWVRSARLPTEEAIAKLDACIDKLDGSIDDHARRIQSIEAEMRHLPTKDDLQRVTLSLTQMLGSMDVVKTELAGTSRAIRRMEDHIRGIGQ